MKSEIIRQIISHENFFEYKCDLVLIGRKKYIEMLKNIDSLEFLNRNENKIFNIDFMVLNTECLEILPINRKIIDSILDKKDPIVEISFFTYPISSQERIKERILCINQKIIEEYKKAL